MIKIYIRDGCPFCAMVLSKVDELKIEIEEKNVSDQKNIDELIEIGGKRQVPYLVDEDSNVSMYESMDIVEYLSKKYGEGASTDNETTGTPPVCEVCPT